MKRLPACGELLSVRSGQRVGPTHGKSHRCSEDVAHAGEHRCACGSRWLVFGPTPISAVMESVAEDCVPGSSERYDGT